MSTHDLLALKARLLIEGLHVDAPSLEALPQRWKQRTEHLYQHDRGAVAPFSYPQEVVLARGSTRWHDTVVNVRLNQASPWSLAARDGSVELRGPDVRREVDLVPYPRYYDDLLEDGTAMSSIVQHLGTDALGVIPNNFCSYFAEGEECRFCEIEPSFRQVGGFRRFRKPVELIVEGLTTAARLQDDAGILVLTAGNLRRNDRTAAYYADIIQRVRAGVTRPMYAYASIMPPEDPAYLEELHEAGFDAVAFNLEFHDLDQFQQLAPGKARFGRERLLERLAQSIDIFGRGHVYSNLVYGIQTWEPGQDRVDWERENSVALEGAAALVERDVVPLFTVYHSSGKNHTGSITLDPAATVDFFSQLGGLCEDADIAYHGHTGLLFNTCTLTNTLYNDALAAERRRRGRAESEFGPTSLIGVLS